MHLYLFVFTLLVTCSCALEDESYLYDDDNKLLECDASSNNCLPGFYCDLSQYKCRPCAMCQEGQEPMLSICAQPTGCPAGDDERNVLKCPDLPKDMKVIECYYGSVLGSWCSVSCSSSSDKHQVVACIVNLTSPNTGNSGAPMLAWNVTVANMCTSPVDSSVSTATTAAFSSTTKTDTTATMQETPQMGAVVDNPASVAIVATAGTNFYLVFAVFAGLLVVILVLLIIFVTRRRASNTQSPTTNSSNDFSSIEQPNSDRYPAAVVKTTTVSVDCERCRGNRHGGSSTCSCAEYHANPSKRESDSLLVPAPYTSSKIRCNAEDGVTPATAVNADVTPQPASPGVGGGQPSAGSNLTTTAPNGNIGVEHEEELSISDMDSTECKRLRLSQYRCSPQQQNMNANLTTPKVA